LFELGELGDSRGRLALFFYPTILITTIVLILILILILALILVLVLILIVDIILINLPSLWRSFCTP
jgi:hypothetical protein